MLSSLDTGAVFCLYYHMCIFVLDFVYPVSDLETGKETSK